MNKITLDGNDCICILKNGYTDSALSLRYTEPIEWDMERMKVIAKEKQLGKRIIHKLIWLLANLYK